MIATLEFMGKQTTRPVRLNPVVAEKVRIIAQWMTDTDHFKNGEEVSMGDLLSKWAEPHIKKHIDQAVQHANEKNKDLLAG
jgi:hypothetical protein